MRKILLTLIAFTTLCTMNVWGTTWKKGGVKIVSSGSTLTVSAIDPEGEGTRGVMDDYVDSDGSSSPKRPSTWSYSYNTIIVEEGVTTIGKYAFQNITNITTIKLPTTLTNIRTGAFKGCTGVASLYYAGSPTDWASKVTFSDLEAHPCGSMKKGVDYYFYGYSAPRTDLLIIEPTITEINPYSFCRIYLHTVSAGCGLGIPGTITKIGSKAFYGATLSGEITINKKTAPKLETDAFNTVLTGLTVYVPTGASGYTSANGWNHFSTVSQKDIEGDDVGSEIDVTTNITWNLSESGVLTLNATGATKTISGVEASAKLPWRYFRRIVYIVKLQGEISALGNMLHYNFGLGGIDLDQTTIPSVSATYIATSSSTAYDALANPLNKLALRVKQKTLVNDTETAKFSSAPWNDGKWTIGLSETATFSDQGLNTDTLEAIKTYVKLPFNLQLNRSLTNAQYNTFCSPIDIPAADITSKFGGANIRALESSSLDGNELTLNFSSSSLSAIEAGKPYLIQPSSAVSNPTFTNIDPSSLVSDTTDTETDYVDFKGTLRPVPLAAGQNILFLGAGNELLWPAVGSENKIKGMRAYFELKDAARNAVKARITMNPNHTTDIEDVQNDKVQSTKVLRNGQIYLMYEGQMYDVHGRRIQ